MNGRRKFRKALALLLALSMVFAAAVPGFADDMVTESEAASDLDAAMDLSAASEGEAADGAIATDEAGAALSEEDMPAMAAWEAALGEYSETPANAYTPSELKNLIGAELGDHAYEPDFGAVDEEAPKLIAGEDYAEGEILFARTKKQSSGGMSLFSIDNTDSELRALGLSNIEEVYTEESSSESASSGGLSLMSIDEGETTVWYKAEVEGDVLETAEALEELSGIVAAEWHYYR